MCTTSNPVPDINPWAFSFEMEINHTVVFPEGRPVIHEMAFLAPRFQVDVEFGAAEQDCVVFPSSVACGEREV